MAEFDELHSLKQRAIPYDIYFGEMDLTKQQKEERKKLAEEIEDVLMFLFSLILVYEDYAEQTNTTLVLYLEIIISQFKNRYREVLKDNVELDDYLDDYIDMYAMTVVTTTNEHLKDGYYTSNDRAVFNAENEANAVYNHTDYQKAVKKGKTKKKWIDIRDNRERKTHLKVGGTVKPIKEPFQVGDSLMQFPKDDSLGADDSEIINCRCTIKYF